MRSRLFILALFAGIMALIYACAHAGTSRTTSGASLPDVAVSELALPELPVELKSPAERASYLLLHFWDNMDFSNPASGCRDTAYMEQNFANFIDVMPHAPSDSVRAEAVGMLLDKAAGDPEAFDLLTWIAETYLNSTDSPMYSESLYMLFLKSLSVCGSLDEVMRERYGAQLADLNRNRPGQIAADFIFVSPGDSSSLHAVAAAHDSTLVVIYDPDCHDCHTLIDRLKQDEVIHDAVTSGSMAVMALYPYDDTELWTRTISDLPDWWIVARGEGSVSLEDLYYIPRTPRTYLLDRDARIVRVTE